MAWRLYKAGWRPDHFTWMQAPVLVLLAIVGYASKHEVDAGGSWTGLLFLFGALQLLIIVLDGADGILARRTGSATRRGHLLDSLFDITGIGITLFVVMHLYVEWANLAFALLLVNFLVYLQNEIQGTKSITYTRGPVTGGLYLSPFFPSAIVVALALPLAIGLILMVSRVAWRKRLWNWYQFLTAGQRQQYKAVPRPERAALPAPPASPNPWRVREATQPSTVASPKPAVPAPDPIDRGPEKAPLLEKKA